MQAILKAHGYVDAGARHLSLWGGLVLLLFMGVLTCVDIILRRMGMGIPGGWEMVTLAMRWMIGLSLPYAFCAGRHVAVEIFTDLLGPRVRQFAIFLAQVAGCIAMTVMCWVLTVRSLNILDMGGRTSDLSILTFYHWLPLVIGTGLSAVCLLSLTLRDFLLVVRPGLAEPTSPQDDRTP